MKTRWKTCLFVASLAAGLACVDRPAVDPVRPISDPPAVICEDGSPPPCEDGGGGGGGTWGPHLASYFGYYDRAPAPSSSENFAKVKYYTDDPGRINHYAAEGQKLLVNLTEIFWAADRMDRQAAKARWDAAVPYLRPWFHNGTIVAFESYWDEPYDMLGPDYPGGYQQLTADLQFSASLVKDSLPGAKMYINYGAPQVNASMAEEGRIPSNFDWVAVNCHGPWASCGGHGMDYYLGTLRQEANEINPQMRRLLISHAWGFCGGADNTGSGWAFNEANIAARARQEVDYAKAHSDIVAVLAFSAAAAPEPGCVGVYSLPSVHAVYHEFGTAVVRRHW
jgi:hypothetical protein